MRGKLTKACAGLLVQILLITLTASFLCSSIVIAGQFDQKNTSIPEIPFRKNVGIYNPEKDGYYAYLPIHYEKPGLNKDSKTDSSEVTIEKSYLPILCFNGTVYVRTDLLEQVSELRCESNKNKITVTWINETRCLKMSLNSNTAEYMEGYRGTPASPLVHYQVNHIPSPVQIDNGFFVPIDVLLRVFGMSPIIQEQYYWFRQPQRNALDILAELYDKADAKEEFVGSNFFYIPNASSVALASAGLSDYIFGLLTFEPESWKYAFTHLFNEDSLDNRYYKEIALDILSADRDLLETYKQEIEEACYLDLSEAAELLNTMVEDLSACSASTLSQWIKDMEMAIKASPNYIPEPEHLKLLETMKRWNKVQVAAKWSGLAVDAACALTGNAAIYANADLIAADGVAQFLSDDWHSERMLSSTEAKVFEKELSNYSKQRWLEKCGVVIGESTDDTILSLCSMFAGKIGGAPVALTKMGLEFLNMFLNTVGFRTVDSADDYIKAFYNPNLIYDVGHVLYKCQKEDSIVSMTPEIMRKQISMAYLFLRLCKLECDYIISSGRFSEESVAKCKKLNDDLTEMMGILTRDYEERDELLPVTAKKRAESARQSDTSRLITDVVTPLYYYVYGEVKNREQNSSPVTDAACNILSGNEKCGDFLCGVDGKFKVCVPVMKPNEILKDLSSLEKLSLTYTFKSQTVEGEGKAHADFKPAESIDLGVVYIEAFNWYRYIRDELEPIYGYANTEPMEQEITDADGSVQKYEGWNNRKGIISASIIDINNDGSEELLLYRLTAPSANNPAYGVLLEVYFRENDGNIKRHNQISVSSVDNYNGIANTDFSSLRIAIIYIDEKPYVWAESLYNSYFWNGGRTTASLYGWDGEQFRILWLNGKDSMGTSDINYVLRTYSKDGMYTEKVLLHDSYSKEEICSALEKGYELIGLPQPKYTTYEKTYLNAYNNKEVSQTIPSYWDTEYIQKVFESSVSGSILNTAKQKTRVTMRALMKDTVSDYTMMLENINKLP